METHPNHRSQFLCDLFTILSINCMYYGGIWLSRLQRRFRVCVVLNVPGSRPALAVYVLSV